MEAVLVLAAWFVPGCVPSAPRAGSVSPSDSLTVATLVQARLNAALRGDTAAWHRQVADDAVWTGPGLGIATTRDVIVSVAANRQQAAGPQQLRNLVVHVRRDIAQASYIQLVTAAADSTLTKRFRKTDVYQRDGERWLLVGGTEIAIADRARVAVAAQHLERHTGTYVLGASDSLSVVRSAANRLVIVGGGTTPDTLQAESDSVFYSEGDRGSWIFSGTAAGRGGTLIYRASGQADVVLRRVSRP